MSANEAKMSADNQNRTENALRKRSRRIAGRAYPRVRYGDEKDDWGADVSPAATAGS